MLSPTNEQESILSLANESSNLQIIAYAGCIGQGGIVRYKSGNDPSVRNKPIEKFLRPKRPEIPVLVQCDINGFAEYATMLGCQASGVKSVLRLETSIGEVIATPDHEIKTTDGWKLIQDVRRGDNIISRTSAFIGRKEGRVTIYSVRHHPHAYMHNIGEYGNYGRISRARLVVEAEMNKLTLEEMILIVRHNPYKAAGLVYLATDLDVHHKDEDPSNDDIRNLEVLTKTEHRLRHKMHLNHTRLGVSTVIELSSAGQRRTYDIMMPGPHHNFLVNGHVVHNCGKTTTLEMFDEACSTRPKLCLAFNKRIAEEMQGRFSDTTDCRTFNSLGHRIWAKTIPGRVTIDTQKTKNLFKEVVKGYGKVDQKELWENYFEISSAVGLAKSVGYVPDNCYPHAKRLVNSEFFHLLEERLNHISQSVVDQVLVLSIKTGYEGNLDYNDQIYLPALFGGTFPKFPIVMVDEAQDLSPTNHAMIAKLAKARLISVGDPFQSIYGFRGAKLGGMGEQANQFCMCKQNLSVSFRCPSEIVKAARWRVPDFKWATEGGRVEQLTTLNPLHIPDGAAIICRNNAPLFKTALGLLSLGRSVRVAGSDIGPKLVGILSKFGDEGISRSAVLGAIEDWEERKIHSSNSAKDLADCMRLFANQAQNLREAIAYANWLFDQEGQITLITGHKSKGLEYNIVYHLDPWLIGEAEQELNLRYVIQTRARESYFEIDSRDIRWKQ